ncbi:MAG TPA: hypothetical protein PKV71_05340 [Calditrichia bacterium]|nr:hypothetical protein [Calditrichota bacterium]HQU73966.1 hypothetical protein [Calditrichia bacterium]HQV31277.1 hypothetical protein [Calditrichia bacterium]
MDRPAFLTDQQLEQLYRLERESKGDLFVMVGTLLRNNPRWSPRQAQLAVMYSRLTQFHPGNLKKALH